MIKLVVFDMAGTTVDEDNVVYKTLQRAITQGGLPVSLEQVLLHGAGKEKLQAIRDVLKAIHGVVDEERAVAIHAAFRKMLNLAYDELDVKPTPGALRTFEGLHRMGIHVALNTGYDAKTANSLLDKLGWKTGALLDAVVTASEVTSNRPEPDMVLLAMQKTGVLDASHVIKVGDSAIDIEEGQNAGCALSIGVTGGAQTREQLEQAEPDFVINDLTDLLPIIEARNAVS
jgi:phosphonatase-like hydrolase